MREALRAKRRPVGRGRIALVGTPRPCVTSSQALTSPPITAITDNDPERYLTGTIKHPVQDVIPPLIK
ncbi:hypothetical protein E2C01_087894 [Portunus trituberculatus]|uniref:Uncharacterized protein n=1 Tax=Portunus trituberculatus TaxID=210409 RepID=A0A5B7JIG6_PORTR|nr:hypothetical protein [Portunus trituberculatus]